MAFTYIKPASVGEALGLLGMKKTRLPVLAGGTDLFVQQRSGAIAPKGLMDISALDELRGISVEGSTLRIGVLTTHACIAMHDIVKARLPALALACSTIGSIQVQNRGTIGGNVMNASPAGDTPPVLLVHEAEFVAKHLKGERSIQARDFFAGYRKTALAPDELLAEIRIPLPDEAEVARFYKLGGRRAKAISKISMAVTGRVAHGGIEWVRIALGSAGPTVVRARGTESLLAGQVMSAGLMDKARRSLADELKPIDDVRSTAAYRRYAAVGLLMKYLREAIALKAQG
jgi:CO/xanthine dehydrogenase FAD-binding subunit